MATADEGLAARIAGAAYLFALPISFFSELYVFGKLVDHSSLIETANRIAQHQQLFRLGTASNFLVFVNDGILITALYWCLRRVNPAIALLALIWRILETSLLFVALLFDMQVTKLLSGAPYLAGVPNADLALLSRTAIGGHGAAYNAALVLAGLGSTAFAVLWWKSGYIPKWLAGFGIIASAILAVGTFASIPFPEVRTIITDDVYGDPIGLFELIAGCWLLIKGIPQTAAVADQKGGSAFAHDTLEQSWGKREA